MDELLKLAKMDDVSVIYDILEERNRKHGEEISLINAAFVLAVGLENKPAGWTIAMEELPALWAEFLEVRAAVPSR